MSSPAAEPIDWSGKAAATEEPVVAPRRAGGIRTAAKKAVAASKQAPKQERTRAPKPEEPPSKKGEFVEDITGFYGMIALAVGMRDPQCGTVIMENAEPIAIQWDKLAESNASVRRTLRALTKTTAVGTLIAAHVPIIMAVSSHHGFGFGAKVDHDDADDNDLGMAANV